MKNPHDGGYLCPMCVTDEQVSIAYMLAYLTIGLISLFAFYQMTQ